jgi:hypothetical protein
VRFGASRVLAMARKRRATIPLVIGPSFRLEPDHFDWKTLESVYGQRLTRDQRKRFFEATQTYVAFRAREMNSEPLRFSINRIERLKNSAESFRRTIVEWDSGSMADVFAHHEIKLQFSDEYLVAQDPLAGLARVVESFVHACELAMSNLTEPPPFWPDGTAWRNWIIELTRIAQESGLPTSARTDTDKNTGGASAFVEFVEKLQAQLPSGLQHTRQSVSALAKAINRARQSYRRDKSNETSKANKSR